jgi:hypothetical protein
MYNLLFHGPVNLFVIFCGLPKFCLMFYGPQALKVWETQTYCMYKASILNLLLIEYPQI